MIAVRRRAVIERVPAGEWDGCTSISKLFLVPAVVRNVHGCSIAGAGNCKNHGAAVAFVTALNDGDLLGRHRFSGLESALVQGVVIIFREFADGLFYLKRGCPHVLF